MRRAELDKKFKTMTRMKGRSLLICGPSKTGKTSLWKKNMLEKEVVKVPINKNKTLEDVYLEILNRLEAFYVKEAASNNQESFSLGTELKAKIQMLFEAKVNTNINQMNNNSFLKESIAKPVIGPELVIKFLKPLGKKIILEDFHYANDILKEQISQDLKSFIDEQCQIIMLSVQKVQSDLIKYNPDLAQRVAILEVGSFRDEQILELVKLGEKHLNIVFSDEVKKIIVKEVKGNAALTQEICMNLCIYNDVFETVQGDHPKVIENRDYFEKACRDICENSRTYYEDAVRLIKAGGRNDGKTEKYKWFLKMVAEKEIGEEGVLNTEVYKILKEMGHEKITQSGVTAGLKYIPKLLKRRDLKTLLDYNEKTKTFYVLDKYFQMCLKWCPEIIDIGDEEYELNEMRLF